MVVHTLLAVGSASRFLDGLKNGDPVAWVILAVVAIFGVVSAVLKLRGSHSG